MASSEDVEIARKGITVLPVGPNPGIDILLIHGLNGSPRNTWRNAKTDFYWPQAIPRIVPEARVMVFGYDTDISPALGSNNTRIRSIAKQMLTNLANERQEVDELTRPLVLIGHSLGGLIIKQALILAAHDPGNDRGEIYRSTISVMFFGTPNAGSQTDEKKRVQVLKKMAKAAFVQVPPKIEAALKSHSDELLDLADDFRKVDICETNRLQIYSFYEMQDTKILGERVLKRLKSIAEDLVAVADFRFQVVDETSSRVFASKEETLGIEADHQQMVKFHDDKDSDFKNVVATVRRLHKRATPSAANGARLADQSFMIPAHSLLPMGPLATSFQGLSLGNATKGRKYYKVPNERRTPNFVGREKVMTEVHNHFATVASGERYIPVSLGLIGMGGIGKTQIALEFCRRVYQEKAFQTVLWINAQSVTTVAASFARIFQWLEIPAQGIPSSDEKVDAVLSALADWPQPYLLVYDNFDDPKFDDILRFVPSFGPAALLFTSRLREVASFLDSSIVVDDMTQVEALELLRMCSGLGLNSENSDVAGHSLVNLLVCLPLAIQQAGAYLRYSHGTISFKTFVDRYESTKEDVMKRIPTFWSYQTASDEREQAKRLSVYMTWDLSLNLLGADSIDRQEKVQFLTLAAFLGGDRVSRVFFKTIFTESKGMHEFRKDLSTQMAMFHNASKFSDKRYKDVLIELYNLSLISGFSETKLGSLHFSIHGLVRDWLVLRLKDEEKRSYAKEALLCVEAVFVNFEHDIVFLPDFYKMVTFDTSQSTDPATLGLLVGEILAETMAHTHMCIAYGQQHALLPTKSTVFDIFAVSLLNEMGDNDTAIKLCTNTMKAWKTDALQQHRYLIFVDILDRLELSQAIKIKDADTGERILHRTVDRRGPIHLSTLVTKLRVCDLYLEAQKIEPAKILSLHVLDTLKDAPKLAADYESSAVVALKAAVILFHVGCMEELEIHLKTICDQVAPASHDQVPSAAYTAARILQCNLRLTQNRFEDAEAICRDLLSQARPNLKINVQTMDTQMLYIRGRLLSQCLAHQERWQEAKDETEKTFKFLRNVLSIPNPLCQEMGIRLATYCYKVDPDDVKAADSLLDGLLDETTAEYGPNDRRTLDLQRRVAVAYHSMSRYKAAAIISQSTYEAARRSLKPGDLLRIRIEDDRAMSVVNLPRRSAEDVTAVLEMLQKRVELFGSQDSLKALLISSQKTYADFLDKFGKPEEALQVYQEQKRMLEISNRPESDAVMLLNVGMAVCAHHARRPQEADELFQSFRKWRMTHQSPLGHTTIDKVTQLANIRYNANQYIEAEPIYGVACKLCEETYGPQSELTMLATERLGRCHRQLQRNSEAVGEFKLSYDYMMSRYGPENHKTLESMTLYSLALCDSSPRMNCQAESSFREVVRLREKVDGAAAAETIDAQIYLANCLCGSNQDKEAALYYRKALEWQDTNLEKNDEKTGKILRGFRLSLHTIGDFIGAKEIGEREYRYYNTLHGPKNPSTRSALLYLGAACETLAVQSWNKSHAADARVHGEEALQYWTTADPPWAKRIILFALTFSRPYHVPIKWHEIEKLAHGRLNEAKAANENQETLLECAYEVALTRIHQSKPQECEIPIKELLILRRSTYGHDDPRVVRCSFWYGKCLYLLGRFATAAEYFPIVLQRKDLDVGVWSMIYKEAGDLLAMCKKNLDGG